MRSLLYTLFPLFQVASLQDALWITAGCFAGIGLIEAVLGPTLFLPANHAESPATKKEQPDAEQALLA